MCDPYLALSAVGTFMQMQEQNAAADRQQRAINSALEQQDAYSRAAERTGLENAQEYHPDVRAQRFVDTRAAAGDSLAQQLVSARETAPKVGQESGRMSEAFLTGQAKAEADQLQKAVDMARMMGKVRGPNDMLTNEGLVNADYASQIGQIGRNAVGSYNAAQPGITAAGRTNNGTMFTGGLMQGLGSAGMTRMGGLFGTQPPAPVIDIPIG